MRVNVTVSTRTSRRQIEQVVAPIARDAVRRAADTTRSRVRWYLSQGGHYDTNNLDRSMTTKEISSDPLHPKRAVGSPLEYAKFLEEGTRGHGPVRAKALRFKPKGSNKFVFAKWVRGIAAVRFMRRALDALTVYDFMR